MVISHSKDTKLSNISDTDFFGGGSLRHYAPGRGDLRSLRASHRFPFQAKPSFSKEGLGGLSISMRRIRSRNDKKKTAHKAVYRFLSGKRDSVHLLPTLYIKQLPLSSTILPIRGTLGLFQGVVFKSDFCHTNFRTTVAYDKFTNNF